MLKTRISKYLLSVILIGMGILIFVWYFFPTHAVQFQNGLQLLSSQIEYKSNITEIKGQIKNTTNKEFYYTDVIFNLYDAGGKKIGSVIDNSGDLKAGKTWSFDAVGPLKCTQSYKLIQLIGYWYRQGITRDQEKAVLLSNADKDTGLRYPWYVIHKKSYIFLFYLRILIKRKPAAGKAGFLFIRQNENVVFSDAISV